MENKEIALHNVQTGNAKNDKSDETWSDEEDEQCMKTMKYMQGRKEVLKDLMTVLLNYPKRKT
jgi:hypothetical protein